MDHKQIRAVLYKAKCGDVDDLTVDERDKIHIYSKLSMKRGGIKFYEITWDIDKHGNVREI